jgi:regulator of protease activity HflC (stomatin/prohibitin superfamily)
MAGLGVCRGRLSGRRASITRFLRVRHLQTAEFSLSAARQLPKSRTNTLINFVPQQQAWVVERFGKYLKTLQPGLNVLIPVVDQIRYVQSLKEAVVDIPSQSAITEDNVTLHLDGVLYYRVIEPYLASYGVENAEYAVVQLAQTTMRSELGKIKLDSVFQERMNLNHMIVYAINHAAEAWGICCLRYEIRDIQLPTKVKEAMQMQVEAERKKRANILESEGIRESAVNRAQGLRQSKILASEAVRIEQVNQAKGEASAILARATARASALLTVGKALGAKHGSSAASLAVAEQYVQAFGKLAKTGNTLLLPEKTGDVGSMVAQVTGFYLVPSR